MLRILGKLVFLWILVLFTCPVQSSDYTLDTLKSMDVYNVIFRYLSDVHEGDVDETKFTELDNIHRLNTAMYGVVRNYYARYYDPIWHMIAHTSTTHAVLIPAAITMAMSIPVVNFMHVLSVHLHKLWKLRSLTYWRIPNEFQVETTTALVFFHAIVAFQYEPSFTFPASFTWKLNGLPPTPIDRMYIAIGYSRQRDITQLQCLQYDINTNQIHDGFEEDVGRIIRPLPLLVQFVTPGGDVIMVHISHFFKYYEYFVYEFFALTHGRCKIWLHYSDDMGTYVGKGEYCNYDTRLIGTYLPSEIRVYLCWSNNHPNHNSVGLSTTIK